MSGFDDFVIYELPKRPFTASDGTPGQILVRSSNLLASRELVWADPPTNNTTVTAGETIGGHTAYVLGVDGKAFIADPTNASHQFVQGITVSAANNGDTVQVQNNGVLTHNGWSFSTNGAVFVGLNGQLTQTVPVSAVFQKVVGIAISPTTVSINIQPAIFL